MKVGLYLQNSQSILDAKKEFKRVTALSSDNNFNLFVCPENTFSIYTEKLSMINPWTSFQKGVEKEQYYDLAQQIAFEANCPIIYGHIDHNNKGERCIYSIYCNPWASHDETSFKMYLKNTATDLSPLSIGNYSDKINDIFLPIKQKGINIGMTICYDIYHPLFSRAYGVAGIDVLINSTGGHVDYHKWTDLVRVRAIENNCYSLCTMSHYDETKRNSSMTFGYNPQGLKLVSFPTPLSLNSTLITYEFNPQIKETDLQPDERLSQKQSINKYQDLFLSKEIFNSDKLIKISEELYLLPSKKSNIVIGIVKKEGIFKPEAVAKLVYSNEISKIDNPRFIIINKWDTVNKRMYESQLLNLIRVRAIENYCAVMLVSNNIQECYQATENKKAQRLELIDGGFWLDLSRCSGPNALWQNRKLMMQKDWRINYELLLKRILESEETTVDDKKIKAKIKKML